MKKKILNPARVRRVPAQFSWVDHRLVRRRLLKGRRPEAWALYLFLVTVADAEGISYYSQGSLCENLGIKASELEEARRELLAASLIAWEAPFYQVLDLGDRLENSGEQAGQPSRHGETLGITEILQNALKGDLR